jgi:hypothetical protein
MGDSCGMNNNDKEDTKKRQNRDRQNIEQPDRDVSAEEADNE